MYRLLLIFLFCISWHAHAFDDPATAVAASQYRQQIQSSHGQQAIDGQAALRKGQRYARQKLWLDAIGAYEKAIAADAADSALWLRLSRAWQFVEVQQPQQRERPLQAAYNAYRAAQTADEKGRALFRLGSLYEQRKQPKLAMTAFKEGLSLEDNPHIAKRYAQLVEDHRFQIKGVHVAADSTMPKICLRFSSPLKKDRQLHYNDFIRIKPAIQAEVSAQDNRLCIEGVHHGQSYVITVRSGIPAANGEKTRASETFTARVGDRQPSLGFRGNTYVLPREGSQNLPLTSVNINAAKLTLLRINDRNLTQQINQRQITTTLSGYSIDELLNKSGEQMWEGEIAIAGKPNQEITTAVPVGQLLTRTQPGIYIIAAEPADKKVANQQNRATQWVVVSDLGLTTFKGEDGLNVFVRSLRSALPLGQVELHLFARNNKRLAKIVTNKTGYGRFDPGLLRGQGGLEPAALMAYGEGTDFNFLDLTQPAFDLSDRGVEGRTAPGPIDAFLYSERGVYRPGETVELMTLLRDNRGYGLAELPLTLKVIRPDQVEDQRLVLSDAKAGGYHTTLALASNARTGTWTVRAYTDPDAEPVGQLAFQVEDFVPQRLKLKLATGADVLQPGKAAQVEVAGRFLYGAPAANLNTEAELILQQDSNPYPNYPGYHFGLVQERWDAKRYPVDLTSTDANGKAHAAIKLDTIPDINRPLQGQLRVSLFEPGGRPVNRTLTLPYRFQSFAIGIRPHFKGDGVDIGQPATFDIIALDRSGQRQEMRGLRAEFYREAYEYYWYFNNNRWDYRQIIRDSEPLTGQTLDISSTRPAQVTLNSRDWGNYRLDVFDPKTGVASSVRFQVGWFARPGDGDSPDQLQISLDKPRYRPGETARIHVKAPFAGEALVTVASNKLWTARSFRLPPQGGILELPVDKRWSPGVYVTATAFRPAKAATKQGPGRAVGVTWLGLDLTDRTLQVNMDTPGQLRPRQRVELPVQIIGAEPGKPTWLSMAAVDEGILQLTDFQSPNPVDYFLGKRRLGVDMLDLYGKIIEAGGQPGKLRVGGGSDSAGRQQESLNMRTTETVSLFSGPVDLDGQGRANISLELPDFNGQLRLMAVAWNQQRLGQAESNVLVRDPLVTQAYLPRFLAPGDTSQLTFSVQNLDAKAGTYRLHLATEGVASLTKPEPWIFQVEDPKQQKTARKSYTLRGDKPGIGHLYLTVEGPDNFYLSRHWRITVRPAQAIVNERRALRLAPNKGIQVTDKLLDEYIPGTGQLSLSFSTRPQLDAPGLLAQLQRYPYGCAEQTISSALPLLYINEITAAWDATDDSLEDDPASQVQQAIQQLLNDQRYDGAFGLWGVTSSANLWLTAYAMDFLTRAKEVGYLVPIAPYQRGLDRLKAFLAKNHFSDRHLATHAYALYVLARTQQAAIGDLRYLHDTYLNELPTTLARAQLGAALAHYGEQDRARKAFKAAILDTPPTLRPDDFGSSLRDHAALVALLAEADLLPEQLPQLAEKLAASMNQRHYTSTQEQAWLLLAAQALVNKQSGALELSINEQTIRAESNAYYVTPDAPELARGLNIANPGKKPLWYVISRSGVPEKLLPPAHEGFSLTRRFYDRSGQPVNLTQVRQNDLLVAVIKGTVVTQENHQALIVDLLPAGLELENARLGDGQNRQDFAWLPQPSKTLHEEFRDDRYVAALNLDAKQRGFTLAYLVRAVTPGNYQLPAVFMEDMYKPWFFGRDKVGTLSIKP